METVVDEKVLDFIKTKKAIKRRKRIITKTSTFLIVFSIFIGVCAKVTSVVASAEKIKVEHKLATYKKVNVLVKKGDTLWSIQEKLTPNEDVREMLYLAEQNAGHKITNVSAGDVVTLFQN